MSYNLPLTSSTRLLRVGNALDSSLGSLDDLLHGAGVLVRLLLGSIKRGLILLAGVVEEHARCLSSADAEEEEVDGGKEKVPRLDDEAPAGPDQTSGSQGSVLGERELVGGTGEVSSTGEDETPLRRTLMLAIVLSLVSSYFIPSLILNIIVRYRIPRSFHSLGPSKSRRWKGKRRTFMIGAQK